MRLRLMIARNLLVALLLATSFNLSSPLLLSCFGTCRSETESCHTWTRRQSSPPACPHSKPTSGISIGAAACCGCAVDTPHVPATPAPLTTGACRNEFSKAWVALHQPAQADASFPKPRLHALPLLLPLNGQSTFLVNSNIRI